MIKVQKVYYCEYDHWVDENGEKCCRAGMTTDESEAQEIDKDYKLATISQVMEFISLGFDVIPIIEVYEGVYLWIDTVEYITVLGDIEAFQGYIFIQPSSDWEIGNWIDAFERQMKEVL